MMTVERLLEYTHMDGLEITFTDGELELHGTPECVAFWTVFVDDYREQIKKTFLDKLIQNCITEKE